jgi:hypothetical protein
MNHKDTLADAVATLRDRGNKYGPMEELFDRASRLSSILLDRTVTPYEITTILKCVKDARKKYDRHNPEHYIDGINYEAFSAQFITVPVEPSAEQLAEEAMIKQMAQALSPQRVDTPEGEKND